MEGSGEADAKVDLIPVKFNVARPVPWLSEI